MKQTLLALFAHPDEGAFGTGGTLARLPPPRQIATLVCATHGEVGQIAEGVDAAPETFGVRSARRSCTARLIR